MGLSWISPLYLTGALLLALPVLIHLVQRHRSNGIKFPSLMFLKQIPLREKRRLEIRNWLLLLLRCLLLLLIVLAFARPFLTATEPGALDLGRRDSVIVIDRSYSMRLADHWQQARGIALKLVNEKDTQDRIAIVVFDENTDVLSDLTTNAENLRSVISRQSPGLKTTRIRLGLEQAARLLVASNANEKRILLISDFQAVGAAPGDIPEMRQDIELKTFPVNIRNAANASISSFTITPSIRDTTDEFSLQVEVTNHASSALDQQISLALNGHELPPQDLRLEPEAIMSVTFDGLSAGGSLVRGVVSLEDDALALDNRAFFVYSNKAQVSVLIVEGSEPRNNQSIYLENALLLSRNPAFKIKRMRWAELKPQDLSAWAVIIINDASIPGGELGSALQDFVAAGGGLLVATGDRVEGNWRSAANDFLPGTLQGQVDSNPGEARNIADITGSHPLANNLTNQDRVDFSSARVFSYRELKPDASDRVVWRYSDGGVALLERVTQDAGRVLVLTTTLDTYWNDIAVQPGFLSFLHQTLGYLAAFESHASNFEIGKVVDVMVYARALAGGNAIVAAADDSTLVIEPPSSGEIRLDRQAPLLTLSEPGFYQVHRATPAIVEVVLAVNVNPTEANLESLDVEQFVEEIRALAVPTPTGTLLTQRQATEFDQQQQLWYLVLCAVLVLLLVEAFSANWIVRKQSVGIRTGS
jgi:hypothetical protein